MPRKYDTKLIAAFWWRVFKVQCPVSQLRNSWDTSFKKLCFLLTQGPIKRGKITYDHKCMETQERKDKPSICFHASSTGGESQMSKHCHQFYKESPLLFPFTGTASPVSRSLSTPVLPRVGPSPFGEHQILRDTPDLHCLARGL